MCGPHQTHVVVRLRTADTDPSASTQIVRIMARALLASLASLKPLITAAVGNAVPPRS